MKMRKTNLKSICRKYKAISCPDRFTVISEILMNEGQNVIFARQIADNTGFNLDKVNNLLASLRNDMGVVRNEGAKYVVCDSDIRELALKIIKMYDLDAKSKTAPQVG